MRALKKSLSWVPLFLGLIALTSGCGDSTEVVVVVPMSPVPGSQAADVNQPLSVRFNVEMDLSSASVDSFTVYPTGHASQSIQGAVSYTDQVLTFTPTFILDYATAYTAEIAGSVKSHSGATLGKMLSWDFTTQAAPPKGISKIDKPIILRPSDFINGQASITLPNVIHSEEVLVIPVQATQDDDKLLFTTDLDTTAGLRPPSIFSKPGMPVVQSSLVKAWNKAQTQHVDTITRNWARLKNLNNIQPSILTPPVSTSPASFGKCQGPYFIGMQCAFQIVDATNNFQLTMTTLRYISPKSGAFWFVDNNALSDLSDTDFAKFDTTLVGKIIPSDTKYFGEIPDTDANGKMMIVFSDILMDPSVGGAFGYVAPWDLLPDGTIPGVPSNEGDIFYAVTPRMAVMNDVTRDDYFSIVMPATMTHEMKHLIAAGHRLLNGLPLEELWIEEPSAVAAEELAGFGSQMGFTQPYAQYALASPNLYRVVYPDMPSSTREALSVYGFNFLFLWHIAEKIGHDKFWKTWVSGTDIGIANLETATQTAFPDLMLDWAPTLFLDHTGRSDSYTYQSLNLTDGTWAPLGQQTLGEEDGTRSVGYYTFFGKDEDAVLTISTGHPAPYFEIIRLKN